MPDENPRDDDELDDPLLCALAEAPPIALGEPLLPPGTVIDDSYELHRVLGAGAMGVVYEATDRVLSRRIAIKIHEVGRSDRAARLWREARAMARLSHPNVVTVHEVGTDGPRGYIAMELVEGTNARAWRRTANRTWLEIVDVYRQAGTGLAAAHDAGIVHRDFKPENVLVGDDGRAKVADFGIASQAGAPGGAHASRRGYGVTQTGTTMGTPAYMAPELGGGGLADARSDQYSFCVALLEALRGARPQTDPTNRQRGSGDRRAPTDTPRAVGSMPAWLGPVLLRGLAVDPAERHPDMRSLVAALDPIPRRRRRQLAVSVVVATLLGASLLWTGGWLASERRDGCGNTGAAIEDTWSPTVAASLQAAFEASAPSIADATRAVVVPSMEAWARGWRDEAREACEATRVRGEQSEQRLDERMDCLSRARRRFAATVTLMLEADPSVMARADVVVRDLPDVEACARREGTMDLEPRATLDRRSEYERLWAALDRAFTEYEAGQLARSQTTLDHLIPELDAAGFTRASAEAHRLRGTVRFRIGHQGEAIEDLTAATRLSLRIGDRDTAASAMLELAYALGHASSGFDEAVRWLATARDLAEEIGWSPQRLSRIQEKSVEIHFFAGKDDEVVRQAGTLLESAPPGSASLRVGILSLLARSVSRQGRFDEALALHDEALTLAEKTAGPDHPQTARVLANRVHTLKALGHPGEVERSLERVLAIREAIFGAQAPVVGETHSYVATAAAERGDVATAELHFGRAIEIHEHAKDDAGLAVALANLANLHTDLKQYEKAGRLIDRALVHARRAHGPRSEIVAQLLINRSSSRMKAGEYAATASELELALSVLTERRSADDVNVAGTRSNLALAYAALGRSDEALAQFAEAQRVISSKLPRDNIKHVLLSQDRAELLERLGRLDEAREAWRETARLAEALLPERHGRRPHTWLQLGRLLLEMQKPREALDALEHAQRLDEVADEDPARTAAIAELLERTRRPRQ